MDSILVVKLGGGAGLDMTAALRDLAEIARQRPLVIVHGVSERMAQLCAARSIPVDVLTSPTGHTSRYTPPAVRDVFVEAAEQISGEIMSQLRDLGIPATAFTQNIAIHGERKGAVRALVNGRVRVIHDDYTGGITGVQARGIHTALQAGTVAVIPPLASSSDGLLNIDGDRAAAAVAAAIGAAELVILSNVRGLYRSYPDESSFIGTVSYSQIEQAMHWAQGRMKRKVLSAQEALAGGVSRVVIGDGRVMNPVSWALDGAGTAFTL
ncbi:MAG: [LysW]-aminoadipate kinase [Anaerolineae bacterium]|nr:[LysW]-aminoadipate kinase [Anaerolineae bacterium]